MTCKTLLASAAAAGLLVSCGEPAEAPAADEAPIADEATAVEPEGPAISALIAERAELSTLNELLGAAGMTGSIDGARSVTVFAPTNAAFEKLDPGTLEFLRAPENRSTLRGVLGYHLLRNDVASQDLIERIEGGTTGDAPLTTSNDYQLTATVEDGKVVLTDGRGNRAAIGEADIAAANGTVHMIDAVLLPPEG